VFKSLLACLLTLLGIAVAAGQQPSPQPTPVQPGPGLKPQVRTMTIPISIFTKQELKERRAAEYVEAETLVVREDTEEQQILSIRSVTESPLSIALLIQEDLAANFNLQLKDIADFIRGLPKGSRVMVAYARSGSLQVRQKFTEDL